jgi:hypothetical protein
MHKSKFIRLKEIKGHQSSIMSIPINKQQRKNIRRIFNRIMILIKFKIY